MLTASTALCGPTSIAEPSPILHIDLQPWPFQREMLQRLEAERERHHRYRNLVVAATGTGKTLVAAFDYRRFRERMQNPSLLFVAHRREILSQSLNAYRVVLREEDSANCSSTAIDPTRAATSSRRSSHWHR